MPQRTPKISVAEIIALRKGGFSIAHISEKADIPTTTLSGWLRGWNVYPEERVLQKTRLTEEWAQELTRLYWDEKMSINDIARLKNMDATKVHDNMRRLGIPVRDRQEAINLAFEQHPEMRNREWMKGREWDTSKATAASVISRRKKAQRRAKDKARQAARKAREESQ